MRPLFCQLAKRLTGGLLHETSMSCSGKICLHDDRLIGCQPLFSCWDVGISFTSLEPVSRRWGWHEAMVDVGSVS